MSRKPQRVSTETMSVSVPAGTKAKIAAAGKDLGLTRSGVVTVALNAWPRFTKSARLRREEGERGSAPSPEGRKKKNRRRRKDPA